VSVINLEISESEFLEDTNEFRFVFSFENSDTDDSGYEVHKVFDTNDILLGQFINPEVLEFVDDREEQTETTSTGIISITLTTSADNIEFGEKIEFFLRVFKKDNSGNSDTDFVFYRSPVSKIEDLLVHFDSFNVNLEWTPKTETNLDTYIVESAIAKEVSFTIAQRFIMGLIISSPDIRIGDIVLVEDISTSYVWSATATLDGSVLITNDNLKNTVSLIAYLSIMAQKLKVRLVKDSDFSTFIELPADTFDGVKGVPVTDDDSFNVFRVFSPDGDDIINSNLSFTQYSFIESKSPKFYPIYESNDPAYGNTYFKFMRDSLTDKNVYLKNSFSLPLKQEIDNNYFLRGNVKISNAIVEMFVDGTLFKTVRSDKNGEFQIEFNTQLERFSITLIAFNSNRLKKFVPLSNNSFEKVFMYTYLSVLSNMFQDLTDTGIQETYNQIFISTASLTTLQTYFGRLLNFTFRLDDTEEKFREQLAELYPLIYNNNTSGNMEIVDQILSFYRDNDYGIQEFTVFPDGDQFENGNNSWKLGSSVMANYGRLEEKRYKYSITSFRLDNNNVESHPIEIEFDNTIYGVNNAEAIFPANVMQWDVAAKKEFVNYNVYRSVDGGSPFLLDTVTGVMFVDDGSFTETVQTFPDFGYTDVPRVPQIFYKNKTTLYEAQFNQFKKNFLLIRIIEESEGSFSTGIQDRISTLIRGLIRPEMLLVLKILPST